jgi:Sigma-70 region 2
MGLTLITAHFVDRLANDARFNLVRCFALLRKGIVMEEVNSQRQQDEFLANVKFVTPTPTDEVLVAAAKLGDHPAFLELWTRHSSRAFKTIYRITGNRDDAEDAIQDAWMKAYLHLNTFDGRAKFSTWFTRIAINSSLTILRRKRAHTPLKPSTQRETRFPRKPR